ncbi:MAG: dipeptide epimerase [Xanthobacteraceae bacterium]
MPIELSLVAEHWPIAGTFTISRGSKTEAHVVVVTLTDGKHRGRGECVPYARYRETVKSVIDSIRSVAIGRRGEKPPPERGSSASNRSPGGGRQSVSDPSPDRGARSDPPLSEEGESRFDQLLLPDDFDRAALATALPAGAARNALDCALWDLEAKRSGRPAHELAGLPPPRPLVTAYTISLSTPKNMAAAAEVARARPLLKVKLGAPGDAERIAAVRRAAPDSALVVDANEGWRENDLESNIAACAAAGVRLIEQPLPAGDDDALTDIAHSVPICADESVHDRTSLEGLRGRYDAVNIKLDKTGGLTEALAVAELARVLGFEIMVGSMVSTSLAIAPALLLAQGAGFVDLDGPLLLASDRLFGLVYEGSQVHPPTPALWG